MMVLSKSKRLAVGSTTSKRASKPTSRASIGIMKAMPMIAKARMVDQMSGAIGSPSLSLSNMQPTAKRPSSVIKKIATKCV
jgi:hypothetical protein